MKAESFISHTTAWPMKGTGTARTRAPVASNSSRCGQSSAS
jgi:hypothetical protein